MNGITLYNPWSINCYLKRGTLIPHWVNTGDDSLIKKTLLGANSEIGAKFLKLVKGEAIEGKIIPSIQFNGLETNEEALWTLLLYAGYLKSVVSVSDGTKYKCELKIPNQEVFYVYAIYSWSGLVKSRKGDTVRSYLM